MKRLILIFIFVSGINLFASSTNFSMVIYKKQGNYLTGYNQYLPDNYCIINYKLEVDIGQDIIIHYNNSYYIKDIKMRTNFIYEKEYIYDYLNNKIYLLKDYYLYDYGRSFASGKILDWKLKYYDLNGKQMQTNYKFAYITISEPNRFGERTTNYSQSDRYYESYDEESKWNGEGLFPFRYNDGVDTYLDKVYKNSLKQPNIIDAKNMGLYLNVYSDNIKIQNSLLAFGSEYQTYNTINDDKYYQYSGKNYILGTNEDFYYIIDLETKSKFIMDNTEYQLSPRYNDMYVTLNSSIKNVLNKIEYEELLREMETKIEEYTVRRSKLYNNLYNEREIRTLEANISGLKEYIEEFKNEKNEELNNEYVKYFRKKFPELENDFYYLGENSISTNSINFIPFKYLKPYFERNNIKTKEQFYKFINFENEK
ncbi:hypothetical protein [Brachyspira aalborgi]|uniref:hypothetical protein n=1 Tax=Brachyspira aalborgi TaxID=29522 RepID=UPI0026657804|nr:hypothetical protein [Brachyspira aalborgi]